MGWRNGLIQRFLTGGPEARAGGLEAKAGEVAEAGAQEATLAEEDRDWRALTQPGESRDIPFSTHLDNIHDAAEAYRVNPLAYRIIELTTDYVLGGGARVVSPDPRVQGLADAFWQANRMDSRQFDLCTELSLSGELFVTFHTNPFTGTSLIRCLPATAIDRIETNPEDIEEELMFHQVGRTTRRDGDNANGRWWTGQECRHYAVNRLVGAVRGQGDLAPLLPWLRRYKDWLTDRVRINKFKGAFLWDVKLEGASERAILMRQGQLVEPPRPGSVLVHNEREEWRAVQPQIDAQAAEPDGKAMRLMVAAGAGIPLHFLAEAEDTNRATAESMVEPAMRHFRRRQGYFGWVLCDIVGEALRRTGRLEGVEMELRAEFGAPSPPQGEKE